jgi:hypothetical protein
MAKSFETLIQAKKQYDATLQKDGEKAVKDRLKEVFATRPEIKAIRWRQYTPYFNDGDECVFHLHGIEARLGDTDDFKDSYELKGETKKLVEAFYDDLEKIDDTLKVVFGDHAEVTATREEVTVESYEHE